MVLSAIINFSVEFIAVFGQQALISIAQEMGSGAAISTAVMVAGMGAGLVKMGLLTAVSSVISAALLIMWLRLTRGQAFEIEYLFEAKRFIIPMLLVQFASQLVVGAGMLACIVPGIILAVGLSLSSILAVDHGLKPLDALSASWEITKGRKLDVGILFIALFLLNFAGALACGMGLLLTVPMSAGALCIFYNSIAKAGNSYLAANEVHTSHGHNDENPGGW